MNLQKLIERFAPAIRDAFLRSVAGITDDVILDDLTAAIADGDMTRAIDLLGLDETAFRSLSQAVEQAFEVGGVTTAESFPRKVTRTAFRFDVRNSRAEAFLRDFSSEKVTAITEQTRRVVRTTVQRGMAEGRNPRSVAVDLVGHQDRKTGKRVGGVIGLTDQQESWVANARRDLLKLNELLELKLPRDQLLARIEASPYFQRARRLPSGDKTIRKLLLAGEPIPSDTVEKLVTRYKSGLLKYRGEVIGRTEAISALNKSEQESINQAVDKGILKASQIKRIWDSAGNDGRTRDSHLAMEGQTVGLNEPFTFPDGSRAMYPGDRSLGAPAEETVQCRCVARTKIDWLADAREVITDEERDALLSLSDEELFGGRS